MGKYINPFTDWGFKRLFGLSTWHFRYSKKKRKTVRMILTNEFMY